MNATERVFVPRHQNQWLDTIGGEFWSDRINPAGGGDCQHFDVVLFRDWWRNATRYRVYEGVIPYKDYSYEIAVVQESKHR